MSKRPRNQRPTRHRRALASVDLMLYSGTAASLRAVRDFVGTIARVIVAARGVLVLDTNAGPLTVGAGDCICRDKANRLRVFTLNHEEP